MDQAEIVEQALGTSELLLPEQFNELLHHSFELAPERRLMLAVLEDALHCWLGVLALGACQRSLDDQSNQPWASAKRCRLHREANRWIFDDDSGARLSFATVCGALNLDPEFIRAKLRARWLRPAE
jgi:hypothetical protein